MNEQAPEVPVQRACPLVFVQNGSPKMPESMFSSEVSFCPVTCEGIKSEPRSIGGVVLPRLFDRVYCDNTQ